MDSLKHKLLIIRKFYDKAFNMKVLKNNGIFDLQNKTYARKC